MKLTRNLKAARAGGHMSLFLLVGREAWCAAAVCDFRINFNAPLSGFRVTLPSVWGPVEMTSEQSLATARGTPRSLGAGESVYERFITNVSLICHALSGSCSKAHIVNGFFLRLKSSLAKSCRWDGDSVGRLCVARWREYIVRVDEVEHFASCITTRLWRDGSFMYRGPQSTSWCAEINPWLFHVDIPHRKEKWQMRSLFFPRQQWVKMSSSGWNDVQFWTTDIAL